MSSAISHIEMALEGLSRLAAALELYDEQLDLYNMVYDILSGKRVD